MWCTNCGFKLGPNDQFCSECGHAVSGGVPSPDSAVVAPSNLNEIAGIYLGGDVQRGRALLTSYLEKNPKNALGWTILGNILFDQDEDAEAERAYRTAIEIDQQAHQSYSGLGKLYRKRREYDNAIEHYRRAVAIQPRNAQAYSGMAVVELSRSKDREALECAEAAYAFDKRDPVIAANLAAAYHYNNMTEERDRMYQECQKLGYRNLESLQRVFRGELSLRDQGS